MFLLSVYECYISLQCTAVEMGIKKVKEEKNFYIKKARVKQDTLLNEIKKSLHGEFERDTRDVKDQYNSWLWVKQKDLERSAESRLITAQE